MSEMHDLLKQQSILNLTKMYASNRKDLIKLAKLLRDIIKAIKVINIDLDRHPLHNELLCRSKDELNKLIKGEE